VQVLAGISIPVFLTLIPQYYNAQQQQLADDKAKQETWVKYLDQMADSLKDGLLVAKPGSKEFIIAQARTVTAFQSLDKKRQSLLIQYLTGAGLNYASIDLKKDKNGNVLIGTDDRVLLYRARMVKIDLKNSDLSSAVLIGANLSAANLGCVPLDSKERRHCSDLRETDLRDANLSDADLSNANLLDANLSNADLSNADLSSADLSSTHLSSTHLLDANISNANILDANLSNADLSNAFLRDAVLSHADLSYANINSAVLSDTDLSYADLSGADLSGAVLINVDIRSFQPQPGEADDLLLCNVVLPKEIKIDPNRDCDQMAQALVSRYPERFSSIEEASEYVSGAWLKIWK